ncbi:MAG: OmpH family outer membrane protein [Candidatus Marinimicrobia bacterium]|nr:OmpH family outer membrane protein [Candidatus Neomarinimicrobiota bacterium]
MKRFGLFAIIAICLIILAGNLNAQLKIGYVNSEVILKEYDEAREAQAKLDMEAKKIQDEYQRMLAKLDSLQREYERQRLIMSEARRTEKENEIASLQREIQEYQIKKLGPDGEIYKKQAEYVGPVLEKIRKVIQKIGEEGKYDYIFDSVAGNILFADPAHDLTDQVLYELKRMQ